MPDRTPIRVLIAEDRAATRALLRRAIESTGRMLVVGEAKDGDEAVRMAAEHRPDVMTMDVNMPVMDGLNATSRIMAEHPCPIVVISAENPEHTQQTTIKALSRGALAAMVLPDFTDPVAVGRMLRTIRAMGRVRFDDRFNLAASRLPGPSGDAYDPQAGNGMQTTGAERTKLIALGLSAGGPRALGSLLPGLGWLDVPILIVLHMSSGFTEDLRHWLSQKLERPVEVVDQQTELKPGGTYLAGEGHHCTISAGSGRILATPTPGPPVNGFCPSINVTFESVAEALPGQAVAALMTGMGSDGAIGLKAIRDSGSPTLAQDRESSVVFGMPRAAVALGAVDEVVSLGRMPSRIRRAIT